MVEKGRNGLSGWVSEDAQVNATRVSRSGPRMGLGAARSRECQKRPRFASSRLRASTETPSCPSSPFLYVSLRAGLKIHREHHLVSVEVRRLRRALSA